MADEDAAAGTLTTHDPLWTLQTTERSEAGPYTFRLTPGAVKTIGRSTTADFIVDAGMVSRFHCRVTATAAGEIEIDDLDSTNGTFVNDRRIQRSALVAGDRVRVGRVELVLVEGNAEA